MSTDKHIVPAFLRSLQRLRDLHEDFTALQLQILLLIAETPDITQVDIHKAVGVTDSAISRNIALLSSVGSRSRDGLGLIDFRTNPVDRRERFLTLTPRGVRLINDMEKDFKYARV